MLSTRNLRSASSGEPSISISQEMVLGLFYLTQQRPGQKRDCRVFADQNEAQLAFDHAVIDLHTPIVVRVTDCQMETAPSVFEAVPTHKRIQTTLGRLIFNHALALALRFKNYEMTKERLKGLIAACLRTCGEQATARLADALKRLGFRYATRSGISFSTMSDIEVPNEKQELLSQADGRASEIEEQLVLGLITAD